ncbi:MAG: hypothetical protein ACUVWJ_00815 [Spirochaetota bacterium]
MDIYQLATTPPGEPGIELSLLNAESTSNTTVRVYFSREVEPLNAEVKSYYLIPGLKVSSAVRDPRDFSVVNLVTYPQDNVDYTIKAINVKDIDGNPIGSQNYTVLRGRCTPSYQGCKLLR